MKTLDQILEGVTSGGKFEYQILSKNEFIVAPVGTKKVRLIASLPGMTSEEANFRYIARACSTWPCLVRALEDCVLDMDRSERWKISTPAKIALLQAQAVLAEALKD